MKGLQVLRTKRRNSLREYMLSVVVPFVFLCKKDKRAVAKGKNPAGLPVRPVFLQE